MEATTVASAHDSSLTSYNIYLVHFFCVVGLQEALLEWAGGPVAIKIVVVCLGALALSFAIGRRILARRGGRDPVTLRVLPDSTPIERGEPFNEQAT